LSALLALIEYIAIRVKYKDQFKLKALQKMAGDCVHATKQRAEQFLLDYRTNKVSWKEVCLKFRFADAELYAAEAPDIMIKEIKKLPNYGKYLARILDFDAIRDQFSGQEGNAILNNLFTKEEIDLLMVTYLGCSRGSYAETVFLDKVKKEAASCS
jgi:hypothetical protein